MTKTRSTKSALISAILALAMTLSCFVGTTFAWFTDSVTSANNIIQSGNLDVELEYWNGSAYAPVTSTTKLFNDAARWEPGYAEVAYLKVSNAGSLALKYQLNVNVYSETLGKTKDGADIKLSDHLVFSVVDKEIASAADLYTRDGAIAAAGTTKGLTTFNGETTPLVNTGDADYVALIIYMPQSVGNEANHNGTDIPSISMGVNLFATQYTSEEDSFGDDYDNDAVATITSPSVTLPTSPEQATEKVLESVSENSVSMTLSADFLSNLAQATDAPESVSISHAEPKFDLVNNRIVFDHIELIDENGDIVDLEAMGNDKPVTVKFNVGNAFNVGDTVIVYHDGEIFATPVVDADKNITYTANHFCEVTVGYNDGIIDTAKEFLITVDSVDDGDVITLGGNITFTSGACSWNSGSWYDGLYYQGDKSFTIDLNGYTITNDSAVNDYLLNFRNVGEKANTITIKNGTVDATSSAFCAICTSSTSTQKITINLENVKMFNNISNGSTAKIRGGAELNVKAGTVITGKNSYLAIECVGATVNIYDGAELYMNGASSYNGCLAGSCYGGTINVYGGYGKGVKGGFIAMTSGGTINVYGGEWIANTDGTVGDNSNLYILTAQSNIYESGFVGPAIINVYGGTLRGGMDAWVLNNHPSEKAELNISGGNFNANPAAYVTNGNEGIEDEDGIWTVDLKYYKVSNSEELVAAINANEKRIYLNAGDYSLRFTNNVNFNIDDTLIKGAKGVTLSISSSEAWYGRVQGNNVTFDNVHFTSAVGTTGKATYNNCVFDSWAICAVNNVETYYNNCTINGCLNTSVDFNSGNVYVTDSYVAKAEYSFRSDSSVMNFENCEINELISWNANTVLDDCTVTTLDDSNMTTGSIIFQSNGVQLVDKPISVAPAPYQGECYEEGTNVAAYKNMSLSGDAYININSNASVSVENVVSDVNGSVIVMKDYQPAIYVYGGEFIIDEGEYLIDASAVAGGVYQIFLVNVTVNGEYLTQQTAAKYLNNVNWYGAYIFAE